MQTGAPGLGSELTVLPRWHCREPAPGGRGVRPGARSGLTDAAVAAPAPRAGGWVGGPGRVALATPPFTLAEGASSCACGAAGSEPDSARPPPAPPGTPSAPGLGFPTSDVGRAGGVSRGRSGNGRLAGSPTCASGPPLQGGAGGPVLGTLGGAGGGGRSRCPGTRSGCSADRRHSPPCPHLPAPARAAGLFPRPSAGHLEALFTPPLASLAGSHWKGCPQRLSGLQRQPAAGGPRVGQSVGGRAGSRRTEWVELGALGPAWLDCTLSHGVVCAPVSRPPAHGPQVTPLDMEEATAAPARVVYAV